MRSAVRQKITFYPRTETVEALKGAPPKKVSERINELIMKGLSKEKDEEIKSAYEAYDRALATAPTRKWKTSSTKVMAERLFTEDEGSSCEDLF